MKLSVRAKEEFYPYLKEIGFYGVDMPFDSYRMKDMILSEEYDACILEKKNWIHGLGLRICQTHLSYYPGHLPPIGNGTYEDYEDYMLELLKKEIRLTRMLDCSVCAIHLYFEEDREKSREGNISLLSKLLPVAKEQDVVIAIENIYAKKYSDAYLSNGDDLMFYLDYFKNDHLKLCFDTGHAVIRGQDPVEMYRQIKDHVAALHLHTTLGNIDLHLLPYCVSYGETIRWEELYEEIKTSGYEGTFNLEVSPPGAISFSAKKAYYLLAYEIAKGIVEK